MGFFTYLRKSHKVSVIYLTIVLIVLMFFIEPSNLSTYPAGGGMDVLVVLPFSLLFLTVVAIAFILVKVETKAAKK